MLNPNTTLGKIRIMIYAILFLWLFIVVQQAKSDKTPPEVVLTPLFLACLLAIVSGDIDLKSTPAYGTVDDPLIRNSSIFLISLLVWILPFIIPPNDLAIGYILVGIVILILVMGIQRLIEIGIYAKVNGVLKTIPLCFLSLNELLMLILLPILGEVYVKLIAVQLNYILQWTLNIFFLIPILLPLTSYILTKPENIQSIQYKIQRKRCDVDITFTRQSLESRVYQFLETVTMRTLIDFILLGFIFLGLFFKLGGVIATITFAIIIGLNDFSTSRKA